MSTRVKCYTWNNSSDSSDSCDSSYSSDNSDSSDSSNRSDSSDKKLQKNKIKINNNYCDIKCVCQKCIDEKFITEEKNCYSSNLWDNEVSVEKKIRFFFLNGDKKMYEKKYKKILTLYLLFCKEEHLFEENIL